MYYHEFILRNLQQNNIGIDYKETVDLQRINTQN